MKSMHLHAIAAALTLSGGLALSASRPAHADTLTTQRLGTVAVTNAPTRGMSMGQVEKRYGAPSTKLPVAGGDTPLHPPIHRWVYPNYTVYFERSTVLTSVATRSSGADNASQ